jgi:hypothetical protein
MGVGVTTQSDSGSVGARLIGGACGPVRAALMTVSTDLLLQALLQTTFVAVLFRTKDLVKPGGRGWVRTSDPPLVRRVLFH